jgi:hypothetical protein
MRLWSATLMYSFVRRFLYQYGIWKEDILVPGFSYRNLEMSRRFTAQGSPTTLLEFKFVYFLQSRTL